MNVLGIETSCDETSAAVVSNGRQVLSNVIFSQAELHGPYGGVVPEIASRSHLETLPGVIDKAVSQSGLKWSDLDAVAVTYGPGLASSLLVGISGAKGLALRLNKPLCAINHLEAHIYSVFLGSDAPRVEDVCPFIALLVSGGHTCLVRVEGIGKYELLGRTVDDAAGEAFDKGANLLGLGYPGGPVIDKMSRGGKVDYVRFPRGRQRKGKNHLGGLNADLCFSFSGLKTALLYYLRDHGPVDTGPELGSIAASYQEAIVDALVERCEKAVQDEAYVSLVGGVSLNSRLRQKLLEFGASNGIKVLLADPGYCADNAAMVAGLAGAEQGIWGGEAMMLDACPNLAIAG